MNTIGNNFRITVWGESHGRVVGVTVDGVPAGMALTEADFETDLARRRAGSAGTTSRSENDMPILLSGIYEGHTTGAPLTIAFHNDDTREEDYTTLADTPRPSHADFAARRKWNGMNDPRGGGHLSGRLTVLLVAAGVVAKKMLPEVRFSSRIVEIGGQTDPALFGKTIEAAANEGDSVGGIVEATAEGVAAGIGEPWFDSVESVAAHLLFSIPAVKGVEFGSGFAVARRRGSENNDRIIDLDGHTATNHDGGITGGIANGNPIVVRVAVKPTPSISRPQESINLACGRIASFTVGGRHDVCICTRAQVVVEAALAIALADLEKR